MERGGGTSIIKSMVPFVGCLPEHTEIDGFIVEGIFGSSLGRERGIVLLGRERGKLSLDHPLGGRDVDSSLEGREGSSTLLEGKGEWLADWVTVFL